MEFEDFKTAFGARVPFRQVVSESFFQEYTQRLYDGVKGKDLTLAQANDYFTASNIGIGYGINFLAELLAGCAREGTIVAKPHIRKIR